MVKNLVCDYLVIGCGAASLAFIDTLLIQIPTAKVIVVDKKPYPGGHWVDAYGYVKLHQPSVVYGLESKQLEGNWAKLLFQKMMLPWKHRATQEDILKYYRNFIEEKVSKQQIEYYPNCEYNFDDESEHNDGVHSFSSSLSTIKEGGAPPPKKKLYLVKVNAKLVDGTIGECQVPSQCPVTFPVDDGIHLITPNKLFDESKKSISNPAKGTKKNRYVVLGCGKTGMDAIVYLQTQMKVDPTNISWVIPNDVWMIARGVGTPSSLPEALLENDGDEHKARLSLEEKGVFVRMDKNIDPTVFKFPVIGKDELRLMRNVKNLIRRGRVISIKKENKNNSIVVGFGADQEPLIISSPADDNGSVIFLHCTSPGPFNKNLKKDPNKPLKLFFSKNEIRLNLLFYPPVTISMSCLGYLEAARVKETIDVKFGKKLLQQQMEEEEELSSLSEHVLSEVFFGLNLELRNLESQFQPIFNLALIIALANVDPLVSLDWIKKNRLSMLSIPGAKSHVYEDLCEMHKKSSILKFSQKSIRMIEILKDKLKVLEGQ